MINRREFFGITLGAGATMALTPDLLRAIQQSGGKVIQRAIPSTGEMLPVISFAPRPFDGTQPSDGPVLKEILKTVLDNGGKVVDVLHGGPAGEQAARTAASELGIQDKFFWTTIMAGPMPPARGAPPPQVDTAFVRTHIEGKLATYKVPMIDLVMVSASAALDNPAYFVALRELKKEGKIRYIGVHELLFPPNGPVPYPPTSKLEAIMRNEQIDFIAADYSIGDRRLEETILPLAQERKIAAMAYFPFDRARGLTRVGNTPLPEWAAEFDAKTWAQFFLKYVVSHPAITVVRTGTTKGAHMLDNIGGGTGRLPNEATRKRMAQLIDSIPATPQPAPQVVGPPSAAPGIALSAAILERYIGEWKTPSGSSTLTFRREGTTLFLKANANPELPLAARSETRLQSPQGPLFEFQVDAAGKVTGVILEQGNPVQRIPLTRVR
jgi:aryl-alcohol dehydrogenase-like predicted oxidoreductase